MIFAHETTKMTYKHTFNDNTLVLRCIVELYNLQSSNMKGPPEGHLIYRMQLWTIHWSSDTSSLSQQLDNDWLEAQKCLQTNSYNKIFVL